MDEIADLLAKPLAPGLYLVATPIGNLADITLRALSVLSRADVIYCEDTRHSAKLLQHYGIAAKTRPFHEHNEEREIERAIRDLESGKRIAMISDAGTPLLSDPGFKLVRAAASGRHSRYFDPWPVRCVDCAYGERIADRFVFLCGLPAAKAGGASRPPRRAFANSGQPRDFRGAASRGRDARRYGRRARRTTRPP